MHKFAVQTSFSSYRQVTHLVCFDFVSEHSNSQLCRICSSPRDESNVPNSFTPRNKAQSTKLTSIIGWLTVPDTRNTERKKVKRGQRQQQARLTFHENTKKKKEVEYIKSTTDRCG